MRTDSKRFIHLLATSSLVALALGVAACDKLTGGGDDGEDEVAEADAEKKDAEKKDDGEKKGDGEKADDGEKTDADKKDGEKTDDKDAGDEANEAILEAANTEADEAKEADPEAAKALGESVTPEDEVAHEEELDEGDKGPISIANVSWTEEKLYGDRGFKYALAADVTINEKKTGGLYTKATCVVDNNVFVTVGTLGTPDNDFGKLKEGETKKLEVDVFSRGLPTTPARCLLSFDFGAQDVSVRLVDFCWDGSSASEGQCKETVKAQKTEGDAIVPFGFEVKKIKPIKDNPEGSVAIDINLNARVNEELQKAPAMHLKTACKVQDDIWVDVTPDFPHVKPFSIGLGEAVRLRHSQFLVNALPGEPDGCNLELYLDGGYRKPSERMGGVCWTGTAVGSGWCDFYEKEQPDPEPLDAESISIDEIGLTWKNDWREKEKVVLQTRLAATVNKRTQEKVMLRVKATCGDQEDRERPLGPNLEFVGAGESVRTRTGMFRAAPLEKPDGKCEVTVLAKPLLGKDAVELGTFCLKGSRINTGACKGSGKPAAIDKEVVLRPKKRRSK